MDPENLQGVPEGASRREFLQRGARLLPYAAPVIASMVIRLEEAEAEKKNPFKKKKKKTKKPGSPTKPSIPSTPS